MRLLLAFVMLLPALARAEVPLVDFVRGDQLRDVQISPDGTYLSEARHLKGEDFLTVRRLSDRKITNVLKMGSKHQVASYWWVGKDRIVVAFSQQSGSLIKPYLTGELVAMDADSSSGRAAKYLFGDRALGGVFSQTAHLAEDAQSRYAAIIRTLPQDGHKAIVSLNDYTNPLHPDYAEVDRLDVYSGALERLAVSPLPGGAGFLTDSTGNPRYAMVGDEHARLLTFFREAGKDEWKRLDGVSKSALIEPLDFSPDDRRVFLLADETGGPLCLVEQTLDSSVRRTLSCDGAANVSDVILSFDQAEPIAALYLGAPPWERVLDSPHPDADKLRSLQKAFPGQIVEPVSATTDGARVVLRVYSDRNPGDYYLFDPKTMNADLIDSQRDWIDPRQMGEQRAVEFKSRDGQAIHGLLTLPPGVPASKLPLVVNPHGGPFGIMDTWGWSQEPQLLASRGYAVLQVNFRGSDGYGASFESAGRQGWDTVMINDITDGTRWAVQQGLADASRICIYGASYGGYAALMSAVREPDLYRCVIGYAGVYDLPRLRKDSDVADTARGRRFMNEFIGDDKRLKAASPLTYIDRLKAAVMIVHGEEDKRAPFSQAKALRSALDERHYSYEWLAKPDEGHGFYEEANLMELYTRLLAFLDRNIGAQANAARPEAAATAAKDVVPVN